MFLEPLLICVVGGFVVANFSARRNDVAQVLLDVAPPVYVAFFTFTGASLDLGILADTWRVALVLFFARLAAITVGSFGGGVIAGEPVVQLSFAPRSGFHARRERGVSFFPPGSLR